MARPLSAQDLLGGAGARHTVAIPGELLPDRAGDALAGGEVTLRPLTLRDVQRVTQAAKDDRVLISALMVQQALVQPELSVEQVASLPAGLVRFLLQAANRLSGLEIGAGELEAAVREPIVRACFVLSREFGWTPEQCSELTLGQVLLYLEMLARGETPEMAL
jgi:hypothetical protein